MIKLNVFIIITTIFILFVIFQIYFYSTTYTKNQKKINKIESFESTLENINSKQNYVLNDQSIETLLEDYNKLKNNT